jgi:hypothetical protein
MFASPSLLLAALLATTPPVFEVDHVIDDAWTKAAEGTNQVASGCAGKWAGRAIRLVR